MVVDIGIGIERSEEGIIFWFEVTCITLRVEFGLVDKIVLGIELIIVVGNIFGKVLTNLVGNIFGIVLITVVGIVNQVLLSMSIKVSFGHDS